MTQLLTFKNTKTYSCEATEAVFPLGGIGTGNISLGARGDLRDWEIFNSPGKGNRMPYTFFAIRTEKQNGEFTARVLEGRICPPYTSIDAVMPGLPRFEASRLTVRYPFAEVEFSDKSLPVKVSMEAFTPFIPLNPEDSGIPCAIFRYKVSNTNQSPVKVSIVGSMMNPVGHHLFDPYGNLPPNDFHCNINEFRQNNSINGLFMYSTEFHEQSRYYGNMALSIMGRDSFVKPCWLGDNWRDGRQDFWDDFVSDGVLQRDAFFDGLTCDLDMNKGMKIGSIGQLQELQPGEEQEFCFILSWYFPNRLKKWVDNPSKPEIKSLDAPIIRNHYATRFSDAWDVAAYTARNLQRIEKCSREFAYALYSSTVPEYIIEALVTGITVTRSNTCFWLENDKFLGWEGCGKNGGSWFGNCTHVWNYAQTLAFLFPGFERSMREVEFLKETDGTGRMSFRTNTILDEPKWNFTEPAADGQLGTIIRLYREWKFSGDTGFLMRLWDAASRVLDFAFEYWDRDGDNVPDGKQHNTYDIEFYGPNPLTAILFLGALKAGIEMAKAAGDAGRAARYATALEQGGKRVQELLWNGEYYTQVIEPVDSYKYQCGSGCMSDQLLGQLLCHIAGLGYVLPGEHIKRALESIYKYNFIEDFSEHYNVQRVYALNDEKGLILCSWPKGGRPRLPFIYCDEVWSGVEYQVAVHLIYEGLINEGLAIVKGVRERHDGYKRNPWNEREAGDHYVRSMSGWGLLTALSGYRCDMVQKEISFHPKINERNFSTFWSTGTAWGIYRQRWNEDVKKMDCSVEVLYGRLGDVKFSGVEAYEYQESFSLHENNK